MKLIAMLCVSLMFTGCAAGINHNIAKLDGKTYLVETGNRNAFGLVQWSEPSTLIPLDQEERPACTCPAVNNAKAYLAQIASECNVNNASRRANYKQMYKCVVNKLAALNK